MLRLTTSLGQPRQDWWQRLGPRLTAEVRRCQIEASGAGPGQTFSTGPQVYTFYCAVRINYRARQEPASSSFPSYLVSEIITTTPESVLLIGRS